MSDRTTLKIFAGWTAFAFLTPPFLFNTDLVIVNLYVLIFSPMISLRVLARASNSGRAWLDLRGTPRTGTIWHKVGSIL